MILIDYHLHTNYSCDSKAIMADMCQAAVERGFKEIGFAEHYDLNPVDDCFNWLKVDAWYSELEHCRDVYADKLIIRAGVEFSEPHLYPQGLQSLLGKLPFDYVIGSLHYVGTELVFSKEYFNQRQMDQAFQEYFASSAKMTLTGDFEILGHMDILALTAWQLYGSYDPTRYEQAIRAVLRNCIQRDIVIEINSQGLRKPGQILSPGEIILGWYVEMGGECMIPGSDAHASDQMGMNIDSVFSIAHQVGLKTFTTFEKLQKHINPLYGSA